MRRIGLNSSGSVWRRWSVIQKVKNIWVECNEEVIWLAQDIDTVLHGVDCCVLPSSSWSLGGQS